MSEILGVNIPAMVTVDGVIMNITQDSVTCLAGVEVEAVSGSSPALKTSSDQSGRFTITEVIKKRADGLQIICTDKNYSFERIVIPLIEEVYEVHIDVIIQPSPKS